MLTDFGISHLLYTTATVRNPTGISGTARWMAPELIAPGESNIHEEDERKKRMDIWSLGMVYLVRIGSILYTKCEC